MIVRKINHDMTRKLSLSQIHQHFPQFSEPGLQYELSESGEIHHFEEGDIIMDYGSYVRMLPLIISGTIKVSRLSDDEGELFLYYLKRGESCTMTFSCCMQEKASEIQAIAEEPATIFALPQCKLDEWTMKYRSWKNFVLSSYDRRMREMIDIIDQISFKRLDSRLLAYLKRAASVHAHGIVQATHQTIADDLNVSREAISRLLKTMEKEGLVELGRNRIRLLPPN